MVLVCKDACVCVFMRMGIRMCVFMKMCVRSVSGWTQTAIPGVRISNPVVLYQRQAPVYSCEDSLLCCMCEGLKSGIRISRSATPDHC